MTTETTFAPRLLQFEQSLRQADRSPITIRNYLSDLQQFAKWHSQIYGRPPDVVQALDIQAYRKHMHELHRMPATINRHVATLNAYCQWQAARGVAEPVQVRYIKTQQEPAPAVLSHAETLRLFKAASANLRDYAIIQLFVQCGLRLAELVRLRPADCEIKERSGSVRVLGKGDKARLVPLNHTAREALSAHLCARPAHDYLFASRKGNQLSARAVQTMVSRYLRQIGAAGSVHSLRHLFATNVLSSGNNLRTVQDLMGHASVQTTQRYTHISANDVQKAVDGQKANVMKD